MLSSGTRDARQAHHTDILASPAPPADSTRARLVVVAEGATASARERRGWPERPGRDAGGNAAGVYVARCHVARRTLRGCAWVCGGVRGPTFAFVACGLAAQSRGGVLTCACGGAQGTSQRARTQ